MEIRHIKENEISQVHELIKFTCDTAWANYYPLGSINYVVNEDLSVDMLNKKIIGAHFYVVIENMKIIGCGGIKPLNGKVNESAIFTFFISPDNQKKGIGRTLMSVLENDEYGRRAKRIEIPSSIPGVPFYKKLGYEHKDGMLNYCDGQFILEKFFH